MVVRCSLRLIEVKILTKCKAGNLVFIPSLTPMSDDLPFSMTRSQLVKFIGIDLTTSIFSHGQLYVALSRCTSSKRINILLLLDAANTIMNVVYPDVLL
ncbi:hypothetical protein GIB67_037429 [Kingdonia uniflora]|uniref:Uncharacterized protein n=1 Tax=Kingdonia uniflora TaxID=39325 RepID=A0A7J7M8K5_9MAGN|nr:hypothetical protein GIB67_037429 [Kingdonia uniflora]